MFFTNFAVGLKCYALQSENEILGWVQNRNFNWRYVRDIGSLPQIISDGKIIFTNITQGSIYRIEWFDTKSSTFFLTDTVISNSSTLEIDVPPIQTDYAFIITKISSTGIAGSSNSDFTFNLKQNFPNPFNAKNKNCFQSTRNFEGKFKDL